MADQADKELVRRAIGLLRQAADEADAYAADVTSPTGYLASFYTGVDPATVRAAAANMRHAYESFASTADRLLADDDLTHERAVSFVWGAEKASDVSGIKVSASRNSLVAMAEEVGAATLADIKSFGATWVLPALGALVVLMGFFYFRR